MSEPTGNLAHAEILKLAKSRFREAEEAERDIRAEAQKDLEFLAGEQWLERDKQERILARRPALTINKLPAFLQQVVNEARQNKNVIKVSGVDNGGDKDTARVIQGLIRHIENDSSADVAYQTAFEYSVGSSFGVFRVLTQYCNDKTFNQEIKIEEVPDPACIYFDPLAKKADRSDGRYAFDVVRMSKEEFKQNWPNSEASTSNFFDGLPDFSEGWITETSVQVATYWYVDIKPRRLLWLNTGETVFADELAEGVIDTVVIERERMVPVRKIKCAKINGCEVLEEEAEYVGNWIPLIPVYGKELIVKGKRKLFSLIRFARDPQQLYNYYKTAQAEAVMLAPKAPFIGVEGQFEGREREWKTANLIPHAYLEYKQVSLNGIMAPAPARNQYEPPIQALSIGAMQASDDIKGTTGIFDPGLGAKSNETSGIAIQARQTESDTANYHFIDNLVRSLRHCGRILIDLIPKIYDTDRWVRIIGEDERERVVRLNSQYIDEETGKPHHYDLSVGKYDIEVKTGPDVGTKRSEAFEMMTQYANAYPDLIKIAGDIIFQNSDVPGADELAKRFRKTLPPELLEEEEDGQVKIPPAIKAKLDQMGQMVDVLTQQLNEAADEARSNKVAVDSKERIEMAKLQLQREELEAKIASDLAKMGSAEAIVQLQEELKLLEHKIDMQHAVEESDRGERIQQSQQAQEKADTEAQALPIAA